MIKLESETAIPGPPGTPQSRSLVHYGPDILNIQESWTDFVKTLTQGDRFAHHLWNDQAYEHHRTISQNFTGIRQDEHGADLQSQAFVITKGEFRVRLRKAIHGRPSNRKALRLEKEYPLRQYAARLGRRGDRAL